MKENKFKITSLLFCVTALMGITHLTEAAEPGKEAFSHPDVTLTEKSSETENPSVIDPPAIDDPELITPFPPQKPTKGPLYVLPTDYSFGTIHFETIGKTYDVLVNEYRESDDNGDVVENGKSLYLPPILVVGDSRSEGGNWNLQVKTSNFVQYAKEGESSLDTANTLVGTTLSFSPEVFNNTTGTPDSPIAADVTKINFRPAVTVSKEENMTLIAADNKSGKGQTSYIHDPDYSKKIAAAGDNKLSTYKKGDRVKGAQIHIPATDEKKSGHYSATLTWTISADASTVTK